MTTDTAVSTVDGYHWGWVTYYVLVHILGFGGIYFAFEHASWQIIAFAVFFYFICHLAITHYAHRFGAHEGFKTFDVVQYYWCLCFSGAFQGPAMWWGGKHKVHHRFIDEMGKDPHTPNDGFWHAHCLWLMKYSGLAAPPGEYMRHFARRANGRLTYKPLIWQSKHSMMLGVIMAYLFPSAMGVMLALASEFTFASAGKGLLEGFLVASCARLLIQYHCTWIVNSLGHTWGERKGGRSATNIAWVPLSWVFAILTVGESLHANHHEYEGDCRLSQRWYEIDPGWYVLWVLYKLGLVWDLKRPSAKAAM